MLLHKVVGCFAVRQGGLFLAPYDDWPLARRTKEKYRSYPMPTKVFRRCVLVLLAIFRKYFAPPGRLVENNMFNQSTDDALSFGCPARDIKYALSSPHLSANNPAGVISQRGYLSQALLSVVSNIWPKRGDLF